MLLSDEEIHEAIKDAKQVNHNYAGWVADQRIEWGRAVQAAILAKLAAKELPPLPAYECGPHTGHAAVRTDESIKAYGQQAHAQGFAAGAAAQLSAEPFTHYRHYDEQVQPFADENTVPLYTRREA